MTALPTFLSQRPRRLLTAGTAIAAISSVALSQTPHTTPASPAIAPEVMCGPVQASDAAALERMRELALRPGQKIEPAMILKDPLIVRSIAEMTTREQARQKVDWPALCRYRSANAALKAPPRVVFVGDSITENWIHGDPTLFGDTIVDRGISGQTSAQILLRFYPDVVALRASFVHLMAGTNDVLLNLTANTDDAIIDNLRAMLDLAHLHHIKVVVGSILPTSVRSWHPDLVPAPRVARLNRRLKALAEAQGAQFVDYYQYQVDAEGGLRDDLGNDGVHPNRARHAVMRPIALRAVGTRKSSRTTGPIAHALIARASRKTAATAREGDLK